MVMSCGKLPCLQKCLSSCVEDVVAMRHNVIILLKHYITTTPHTAAVYRATLKHHHHCLFLRT